MSRPILLLTAALFLLLAYACSYTMKVQDGAMALDRKQYAVAVEMLKKEYNKAKSRVERGRIAYRLGQAYEGLNQGADAIDWFRIAKDNSYGLDAMRAYAFALKQGERYGEAKEAFRELGLEIGSPYEYRREIQACELAEQWLAENRPEYQVTLADFNSTSADYSPVLFGKDQLVVTSDRAASTGDDTYNWTGRAFSDLFVVNLTNGTFASLGVPFNTDDNEGAASFTTDQRTVYFTRCSGPKREDAYCKLMVAEIGAGGNWGPPRVLPFVQPGMNYMHPAISADGNVLVYASNNPEGWGGYDLYQVTRNANGDWSEEPQLLSRSINTAGDEQFPYLDADTLYFASNGHPGMGGLDLFRAHRLASGGWSTPQNLRPPLNSGADDFGLVIDRRMATTSGVLQVGYYSTRRADGAGSDDIYRFEKVVLPPPPPQPVKPPVAFRNLLDVYVLEKIYQTPDNPNSRVIGRKPLPGASLEIKVGRESRTVSIDESGKIQLELRDNAEYNFLASNNGYLNNQASFSAKGLGRDPDNPEQVFEIEIVLDRIFLDQEIRLENIYYDFDQWFIRDDAKPTLDQLAELLKLNPAIRIQMGSHTDCRGSDRYNEELSQRRAQSAVDYLISLGIDPGRLAARGYGETLPETTCICARCTEDEHQFNRRTTFKIIE